MYYIGEEVVSAAIYIPTYMLRVIKKRTLENDMQMFYIIRSDVAKS